LLADLLYELVQIPGPSGHEGRVAARMEAALQPYVDEVWRDRAGNVIAKKAGRRSGKSLMLAAHLDEVSLVVSRVGETVAFEVVGWIDRRALPGTPVLILGRQHDIPGVICSPSAHLAEAGDQVDLWIDVGEQTSAVSVGDPVVFATPPRWFSAEKTILASHAVDDRVGLAVLVEVARSLEEQPEYDLYFAATVQEEVGSYGAVYAAGRLKPTWVIALDTTFARDPRAPFNPPLGSGPVVRRFEMSQPKSPLYPASILFTSRVLGDALVTSSQEQELPINEDVNCRTFTDTSRIFDAFPDIACCPLLIPRRYSHSPCEVVDVRDAAAAARILVGALPHIFASAEDRSSRAKEAPPPA